MKFKRVVIVVGLFVMVLFSQPLFAKTEAEIFNECQPAAEQGDADAMYTIGRSYEDGNCVPKNFVEAMKWIRKSANLGNGNAQFWMGACYFDGKGVLKIYPEAIKWWRKAVDNGNVDAMYMLGVCYEDGLGTEQRPILADLLYNDAAKFGNMYAQYKVGCKLLNNRQQDAAVKWLQKAAAQGHEDAKKMLQKISEQ